MHCSRQSSNQNMYVVPVYHLNTRIQEPINIDIRLNWKICNYYYYSTNYLLFNFYDYSINYYTCENLL